MEYTQVIKTLDEMKSRFHDGFSSSDRELLDKLHRLLFNREITNRGCSDCYRDAYLLISVKLKQLKDMPNKKSNYVLKAGALLRRAGDNKFYSNPLPNDEIPEKHLADFPEAISLFASYPNDWQRRVEARKEGHTPEGELSQEEAQNIISGLKAELQNKDDEIATLNLELKEKNSIIEEMKKHLESAPAEGVAIPESEEVGNLKLQLTALTADLESANNEISALKEENSKLKEAKTTKKASAKKEEE